jgi:hypothetical protein
MLGKVQEKSTRNLTKCCKRKEELCGKRTKKERKKNRRMQSLKIQRQNTNKMLAKMEWKDCVIKKNIALVQWFSIPWMGQTNIK